MRVHIHVCTHTHTNIIRPIACCDKKDRLHTLWKDLKKITRARSIIRRCKRDPLKWVMASCQKLRVCLALFLARFTLLCVCVCMWGRERKSGEERQREKQRECVSVCMCVRSCVCVYVRVWACASQSHYAISACIIQWYIMYECVRVRVRVRVYRIARKWRRRWRERLACASSMCIVWALVLSRQIRCRRAVPAVATTFAVTNYFTPYA